MGSDKIKVICIESCSVYGILYGEWCSVWECYESEVYYVLPEINMLAIFVNDRYIGSVDKKFFKTAGELRQDNIDIVFKE